MYEVGKLYELLGMDTIMKVTKIVNGIIHYNYCQTKYVAQETTQSRAISKMADWVEIKER